MALALAISTPVVFAGRTAAADSVSDLRAQAAVVSQQLVRQQLAVDAYQQHYQVETAVVAHDAALVSQAVAQVDRDQQQIAADRHQLEQKAVALYVNSGTSASQDVAAAFTTGSLRALVKGEYQGIAVGNITTTMDRLHADQTVLSAHEAVLRQQQAQDEAAQSQAGTALANANTAQQQLRSEQAQVTGQLAVAVAQQQQAAAAAAAAAVQRAQQQAAEQSRAALRATYVAASSGSPSSSTSSTAAAPAAPAGSPADPALNRFLQCVVQHESGGNYAIVSPGGTYMGAFQFSQSTWNTAAAAAGLSYLVGVRPNTATKAQQDTVAVALYSMAGGQPWVGDGCTN